jgi:hypothetical protein
MLEAFGKLFPDNMKMYVYPAIDGKSGKIKHSGDISLPEDSAYLYKHLISARKILDIKNINEKHLSIFSPMVLDKIKNKDNSWEKLVPVYVAESIKSKKLFGYND